MSIIDVNIFFDESGKGKDSLSLMGGLLIPDKVYKSSKLQGYNKQLQDKLFSLHWTKYNGDSTKRKLINEIMLELMKYHELLDFNVILYERPKNVSTEQFDMMLYTKFPERIFYGLLRFHGSNASVKTKIYIENATEYKSKKLDKKIIEQLNIQSTYRGENFKVTDCEYRSKNQEIGVEITDILLGVIRSILENDRGTKTKDEKSKLVIDLLKEKNFYNFIKNIKFFEWKNTNKLERIDFDYCLRVFLSSQKEWLEYIGG